MWWNQILAIVLIPISVLIFLWAVSKSKAGQFYGDTPYLWPLGIYVWGDALVLAPFWLLSAGLLWVMGPLISLRYLAVFFSVRAAFEVVYWLNHQFSGKRYQAPLLKKITWLSAADSAVLYQVMNMCLMMFSLGLLLLSYR